MNVKCRLTTATSILCGVVMLASCATLGGGSWPTLANDDHLIVNGERVGPIRLGMSEDELVKLGAPTATEPMTFLSGSGAGTWLPGIHYSYGDDLIRVNVDRASRRVVGITLGFTHRGCGDYHTPEGVTCGSTFMNVMGAYGDPYVRRAYDFKPGLLMWVTYLNNGHQPRSVTTFDFMSGDTMADLPVSGVQSIRMFEGGFGDYDADPGWNRR